MKILHILDHSIPLHSGYTFRTKAILEEQHRLGWHTAHITSGKQGRVSGAKETIEGLDFYRTPISNAITHRLPLFNQWQIIQDLKRRLASIIDEVKPDILHAHSPSLNALAALNIAKQNKLPLLYEVRALWEDAAVDHGVGKEEGLRYRLSRQLETYALKKADAITTICEGLREDIASREIKSEKITVIPNGVNVEKFQVSHAKNKRLVDQLNLENEFVLGFIGSFYFYEGLDLLIEAMKNLSSNKQSCKLLLVGGGPARQSLEDLASDLGVKDKVIFTGRVSQDIVSDYYSLIDLLVYPRRKMRLTDMVTPLKALEAMAQGKAVLASDVGGHKELITDGKNGFLFASDDVSALVEKINVLSETNLDAVKKAGREFVERERSWKKSVAHYADVYQGLLNGS